MLSWPKLRNISSLWLNVPHKQSLHKDNFIRYDLARVTFASPPLPNTTLRAFQINRIMKNAALIESDKRAARTELSDERRMHHTTMRYLVQVHGTTAMSPIMLAFVELLSVSVLGPWPRRGGCDLDRPLTRLRGGKQIYDQPATNTCANKSRFLVYRCGATHIFHRELQERPHDSPSWRAFVLTMNPQYKHQRPNRKKKRVEAIVTELQAQFSMALSSATGRPFSPSNINLSPRRPKNQWGSPRPPAPGRAKVLIREGDDRGGGYREVPPKVPPEVPPESGKKSVSKVSMFLVPPRKSGEDGDQDDREIAGAGSGSGGAAAAAAAAPSVECVAATTTTAAAAAAARRDSEKPPERGRDEARPAGKGHALVSRGEKDDGDDIPELLPCGSGSEVTTGDVWGMLDSYVHRRSEVARANRHLGAIEAMRRVRRGEGV